MGEMVSSEMVSGEVAGEALVGIRKRTIWPLTTHHLTHEWRRRSA